MLKTQTATAIIRSRLTVASSIPTSAPGPGNHSITYNPQAKMSTTDGSVRAPPPPSAPTGGGIKTSKSSPSFFPLGYKDAAYQWWNSVTPPMVEHNVLKLIPTLKEAIDTLTNPNATEREYPIGTRTWKRTMVQLSGKNRALNEVTIERVGEKEEETLVMVHGYGAGLGFFYKNFEPISRVSGLKIYALDMLGMGNSSRPSFKIHAKTKEEQVIEAENWFIDALEEWRKARKIERFTLLGHSLGGYLAVSYALKYPGHLKKLILASPVGIPKDPYAVDAAMPEPEDSTIQNEFTQDQQTVTETSTPGSKITSASSNAPAAPKRPMPSWFVWLWDANVSPFSIVRMTGPLGPRFVSGWSHRRFNHLPSDEAQALHDYSFSIFKQKGSGEYALAYILAPGAYARRPVIDRIQGVGRQIIPNPDLDTAAAVNKETGIPVVFMYGENDWMDVNGGRAAEEKLNEAKAKALETATPDEKRRENGSAKVVIIPKSGHHLYLDNADEFNEAIRKELEDTKASEKERRRLESL